MIGSQCAAARAMVQVSRPLLASKTGVPEQVIYDFEHLITEPDEATIQTLKSKLEDLGAFFIPDDKFMGAGVRLKFNRSITRRIATFENEGGPSHTDDVP
ncbi:MAG: XRE family transcriptional regulator [Xanthobacteraceae bacterium]